MLEYIMIVDFVHNAGREFLSLILAVLPYFLVGAIVGALLEVYLKPEKERHVQWPLVWQE